MDKYTKENRRKYNRRYRETHREKVLELRAKYGNSGKARRNKIIKRDGAKCASCGTNKNLTLEHKQPQSAGGTNDQSNLEILCLPCNKKKYHELVRKALKFYFEHYKLESPVLPILSSVGKTGDKTP